MRLSGCRVLCSFDSFFLILCPAASVNTFAAFAKHDSILSDHLPFRIRCFRLPMNSGDTIAFFWFSRTTNSSAAVMPQYLSLKSDPIVLFWPSNRHIQWKFNLSVDAFAICRHS
ncbi:hypothetical protein R3P38DRAFT_2954912 [Favolaschia claudopus]|uniref:Secreted protein n=1 Tax=Favolaschia claudopus TaxID=2862362 RepID=A0AAW0BCM0_9AGAR